MGCIIQFEGKRIVLDYLAEGAANVVYKIRPVNPQDELPDALHGVLLRFRKAKSLSMSCKDIVYKFDSFIAPLFPSQNLVHPILFRIPKAGTVISTLNEALLAREAHGRRPETRHGVYLATDEENCILVQDMTPRNENEKFIEFKPKWLSQSPSAPKGAKRCRTCALREMRRAKDVVSGRGDSGFCPLDLLRDRDYRREQALELLSIPDQKAFDIIFEKRIQPLLFLLKDLQTRFNRVGLADFENVEIHDGNFDSSCELYQPTPDALDTKVGMTIRDCSLFVRYSTSAPRPFAEVKLADLDMKGMKHWKWADVERQLIDGGWYTGTEKYAASHGRSFCSSLKG